MRVRWFGEAWPTPELRAPICDDDDYRIDTPTDQFCIDCEEPIGGNDRGIVCGCSLGGSPELDKFVFTLEADGRTYSVCVYHIDCWIRGILPGAALIPRQPEASNGN